MRLYHRAPTEREKQVLRVLYEQPGLKPSEICEAHGIETRQVQLTLIRLRNLGLIEYVPRWGLPRLTHRGFETVKHP